MMVKPGYEYILSIPQHEELGPGLLRKLIRQAGLTAEEFNGLLFAEPRPSLDLIVLPLFQLSISKTISLRS